MAYRSKKVKFLSNGIKLSGRLFFSLNAQLTPGAIFVHGGGSSSKERFIFWQKKLARMGISSLAFDFRGIGQSRGEFSDSSLNNRVIDLTSAFNFFVSSVLVNKNKIAIVGSSMGAHIAIRFSQINKVQALILIAPAAYAAEAENKKMDFAFTKAISKTKSWSNSPAFLILKKYKNPVMVIYGDKDEIIPEEIRRKYQRLLKKDDVYLIIENGIHTLLNPKTASDKKIMEELILKSNEFLSGVW